MEEVLGSRHCEKIKIEDHHSVDLWDNMIVLFSWYATGKAHTLGWLKVALGSKAHTLCCTAKSYYSNSLFDFKYLCWILDILTWVLALDTLFWAIYLKDTWTHIPRRVKKKVGPWLHTWQKFDIYSLCPNSASVMYLFSGYAKHTFDHLNL